jgi:hypothetical protein
MGKVGAGSWKLVVVVVMVDINPSNGMENIRHHEHKHTHGE